MSLVIGKPGWRYWFGAGFNTGAWRELTFCWRLRETQQRGTSRYHFTFSIEIGRCHEHIDDFGGPGWMPWLSWRRADVSGIWDVVPSARWTGRRYVVTGFEWRVVRFRFTRIPEA